MEWTPVLLVVARPSHIMDWLGENCIACCLQRLVAAGYSSALVQVLKAWTRYYCTNQTTCNVTFAGLPCNLQSVQKPVAIPAREERQDLPLVWDDANLTQVWICLALLNR